MGEQNRRCPRCDAVVTGPLCTTCGAPAGAGASMPSVPGADPTVVQPAIAQPASQSAPPPVGQPLSAGPVAVGHESRSPLIPVLVASCVAVLIVTAGVVAAITLAGDDEPVASPETTTSTTVATTTTTTTTTPSTTVAPPPQVVVVVPAPATGTGGGSVGSGGTSVDPSSGDEGLVTSPSSSRPWVAVVASIEKSRSDGFAAASNAAEATSMPGYYLDVLDGDEFAGLKDGYWVAAGVGMATRDEAEAACKASGLGVTGDGAGGQCYMANVVNFDR